MLHPRALVTLALLNGSLFLPSQTARYSLADLTDMLESGMTSNRVLSFARQGCLTFEYGPAAERTLQATRATEDLVRGLRDVRRCRTVPGTRPPAPPAQRRPTPPRPSLDELRTRGDRERRAGNHAAALSTYREILRLAPGSAGAHNDVGVALFNLGRVAEAIDPFRSAIRLSPGTGTYHDNLAHAYVLLRRYEEAERAARAGLEREESARGHYMLGLALEGLRRREEARAAYDVARRLAPQDTVYMRALARLTVPSRDTIRIDAPSGSEGARINSVSTATLDVPRVGGRVLGVKFLEGVKDSTVERYYHRTFLRGSTRFVWACVELEHPAGAAGIRTPIEVEAVYFHPDGTVLGRALTEGVIEPGKTFTVLQGGLGWADPNAGWRQEGIYRVEILLNGVRIATGAFEVLPAGSPRLEVPAVNGRAFAQRTFAFRGRTAPSAGRVYRSRFPRDSLGTVGVEIGIAHPRPSARVPFTMGAALYDPTGAWIASYPLTTSATPADGGGSVHTIIIQLPAQRVWSRGMYRVEVRSASTRAGTVFFDVY